MLTNHFFSPQKRRPSQKMPPRVSPATGLNASWTTRQSRISAHMKVDMNSFYCRCVTNMHRKRRLSLIPKRLPLLKLLSFFIDLAPDTLFSDLVAMEALTNITCTYNEDYTSFCLSFFFAENPFFTNEVSPSPRLQSERILLWYQTKGARCTLFEYRILSNSEHLTPWTYFFSYQVLKKTYTVSPDLLDEKSPTLTGHASSGEEEKSTEKFPLRTICISRVSNA